MAVKRQRKVMHHTNNASSTCGPGCRCVRQFPVFDSVEADFRRTGVATCEEEADELGAKRAEHGFEPVRINRAGRCLVDWNEKLKAEKAWLYHPSLAVEDGERVAREQKLAEEQERKEREERENAELSRLVVE